MSELETYIQSYFGIEQKEMATIAALFKPEQLKKATFI